VERLRNGELPVLELVPEVIIRAEKAAIGKNEAISATAPRRDNAIGIRSAANGTSLLRQCPSVKHTHNLQGSGIRR
jgi:hypothetical protein